MTKNDLTTLVAVLDAAQKAGIIAPDAMGLVYQARVSSINLANAMKDTDMLAIVPPVVPKQDIVPRSHTRPTPEIFKEPGAGGILNLPGVKEEQEVIEKIKKAVSDAQYSGKK